MQQANQSSQTKPKIAAGICAALAMSAIDAMAYSDAQWEMNTNDQTDLSKEQVIPATTNITSTNLNNTATTEQAKRWEVLGEHIVSGPKASQGLGHAWYQLANKMQVDGKALSEAFVQEGLGEFIKTQAAGQCYNACYGNCYGNCYSNCFSADS